MRIRWRGLELPTRVVRDEDASRPTYGRFVVEPFERGFGTTIGNSLRRILLSSLEGAAVTHVKIKGVVHEFTTLPGVMEDVTVIILNVKSLIVQSASDTPKTMRVSVRGTAGETTEVRASQIEADPDIEIINQDQILATLTDDIEFDMEMTVVRGRSYATAEENKPEGDQVFGLIPIDSMYSPVTRVRYRVEDTRVGQRTNYDRLLLEIWTNGTVTPEMALVEAAKILRKHLNSFVQLFEMGSGLAASAVDEESRGEAGQSGPTDAGVLSTPIASLDLSVRANNCLASAEIATVGELVEWDEPSLLKLRSFGKTSLREIKRKLADLGVSLKSDGSDSADDELSPLRPASPSYAGMEPTSASFGDTVLDAATFGHAPPASATQEGESAQAEADGGAAETPENNEVGAARNDAG
ncbi:MAG: DNA-directed RNA polymerase subunit alpha [Planctomycetota bacterium]